MAATAGSVGNRATTQIVIASFNGVNIPTAYLESSMINARKQKLLTVDYLPGTEKEIKGVLIFAHGLAEHVGRYKDVFSTLAAAGLAVYSFDAHGHGRSEPRAMKERAYVQSFEHLVADFQQRLDEVKQSYTDAGKQAPPIIVGGHSLGGLIAAHVAARAPDQYAGLILHSAAIDVEWTAVLKAQAACGGCLAACCPFAKIVPAVRLEDMSQDKAVVKAYMDDPLNYVDDVKARTAHEILGGFKALSKLKGKLTLPIYGAHGTADKCTSLKAAKQLVHTAPSTKKVFFDIQGGYHEVLMGPEKDEALNHMITWVTANMLPADVASSATKAEVAAAAEVQLAAKQG